MCVDHMCAVARVQKRVLCPLDLELQMVVSHYVGELSLDPLEGQQVLLTAGLSKTKH